MQSQPQTINTRELAGAIERLTQDVTKMRELQHVSIQDAQNAANSLTRVQLILNELERVEVRERGASREMAERIVTFQNKIRMLRFEIYQELRGEKPAGSGRSDGAYDPAR